MKQGAHCLYDNNGQSIQGEGLGIWSMEFHHIGLRGLGIDIKVKVSNSIFEIQDGVQITKNTRWMFKSRGYGNSNFRKEEE